MNNPNEPATKGQTFAIFCLAKYDVRNAPLTKARAGYLIDALKTGTEVVRTAALAEISGLPNVVKKGEPAKPKQDWQAIYNEARQAGIEAANKAIVEPMVVNEHASPPIFGPTPIIAQSVVYDGVCGFAWVTVRPANCSFGLWLVKNKLGRSSHSGGLKIWVHDFNQSLTRKEAYAVAFSEVLNKHGINSSWGSNID